MRLHRHERSRQGTILILALWVLGLLTVFTVSVGMKVQQKIILASRLEKRNQVVYAAEAGILKAVALLKKEQSQSEGEQIARKKSTLLDSSAVFKNMMVGAGTFDVSYWAYDSKSSAKIFGIVDEERKLNINACDRADLESLLDEVAALSEEEVNGLADAITDWRESGQSEATGFFSDEYYENLQFPYRKKNGPFETMDELLLVRGMSPPVYGRIAPFITVYGAGQVNMNTAPKVVLMALGMDEKLANKIIRIRRGLDNQEITGDDIILPSGPEMLGLLNETAKLDEEESQMLENLFRLKKIGAESSHFLIQSQGHLNSSPEKKVITCVFDLNSGKIKYWREN